MGNFKRKCASCGNMTDKLYNFPSNLLIKEKWKDALGISELRPGDKICYLHFKDSDFQGRGLKRCGVLPSLKLHNQPDNIKIIFCQLGKSQTISDKKMSHCVKILHKTKYICMMIL